MSKVITFSRFFPGYHPRKKELTHFVEKICLSFKDIEVSFEDFDEIAYDLLPYYEVEETLKPKHHTIRAGHRWKVGDKFSARCWSGRPYHSKQVTIANDAVIKKVFKFDINEGNFFINDNLVAMSSTPDDLFLDELAKNDGLSVRDLLAWLKYPDNFSGQIICWNDSITYL